MPLLHSFAPRMQFQSISAAWFLGLRSLLVTRSPLFILTEEENFWVGTYNHPSCSEVSLIRPLFPILLKQNGCAERFNCILLEKVEAMQQHACLPKSCWQDTVKTSLHIYNHQPMHCHNWKMPIEIFNGDKPNVSYFRVLGTYAHVFILQEQQHDKLSPKAEEMIFIGYEPNTKGYCFWSQQCRQVFISTNAIFDETVFPYCSKGQEDGLATIPLQEELLTTSDNQQEPESCIQDPEPYQDIYIQLPIGFGQESNQPNSPDDGHASGQALPEPWNPGDLRSPSPLHLDATPPPSYYPSPMRPPIKRGKPNTGLWSSIEDWHQYKCYEVTDSPESSSKDTPDQDFQVPAAVQPNWMPPRQQSGETLTEFHSHPHYYHPL